MKFDIEQLAKALQEACPDVVFALLHGSAKDGSVSADSDIDIALFAADAPTLDLLQRAQQAVATVAPPAEPDIGILNRAEPVYRFEALKGTLLFCRDDDAYQEFFSRTCREYESQMASYERQRRYRGEAKHAVRTTD